MLPRLPRLACLVCLLALCASVQALAADKAKPPIIAVLDAQLVLQEATAAKAVRDAINAKKAEFEERLAEDQKALKADEATLRQQQTVLAPEAFNTRRRQLERRYADLRRRSEDASARLLKARNVSLQRLRREIALILKDLMDERGISVTLLRKAVLMYDERLNVSQAVLERLNERLPRLEVVFEQDDG